MKIELRLKSSSFEIFLTWFGRVTFGHFNFIINRVVINLDMIGKYHKLTKNPKYGFTGVVAHEIIHYTLRDLRTYNILRLSGIKNRWVRFLITSLIYMSPFMIKEIAKLDNINGEHKAINNMLRWVL